MIPQGNHSCGRYGGGHSYEGGGDRSPPSALSGNHNSDKVYTYDELPPLTDLSLKIRLPKNMRAMAPLITPLSVTFFITPPLGGFTATHSKEAPAMIGAFNYLFVEVKQTIKSPPHKLGIVMISLRPYL